jgi:uncharacterized protein (TIGR02246 family)
MMDVIRAAALTRRALKIAVLIFCIGHFGELNAQPEKEIRALLSAQQKAWNDGDIEGFMEYYWKSDSLRFMTKEKVTKGWNATLKRYKQGYPDKASMGQLDFDILSVEILGAEYALVTGKWTVVAFNEKQSGHFNLLLRKLNGKWRIVLDHTS